MGKMFVEPRPIFIRSKGRRDPGFDGIQPQQMRGKTVERSDLRLLDIREARLQPWPRSRRSSSHIACEGRRRRRFRCRSQKVFARPPRSLNARSRSRKRSFISVAALFVKVKATICDRSSGSVRRMSRYRSRLTSRVVFPVPAPAITTTLRSKVVAAAIASRLVRYGRGFSHAATFSDRRLRSNPACGER